MSWRRGLVIPALLAALVVAPLSLGQAVAATNVPPTAVGSTTPGDRGLPFSEVRFATADGIILAGWYIPSRNRAAVVLLHGAGSTRSSVLEHAVVLARHEYGVLLFDARGHGRSGGRAMDFGWRGTLQEGLEWLTYGITDLLTAADQPIALRDAVAVSAPRPVLLIAGGDKADEARAGRYIQSASPATVDLWIVSGAGHTAALGSHPGQWEERVTAFLADALHLDGPNGLR
ncbi:alpha/beta hydrolase [Kribbella qitaiheensis]|uniref:alpha/beta hydrolase n=1 Tax=Kribbella qitaiheensis TaxID=1544730 RepID=UPI00360C8FDC